MKHFYNSLLVLWFVFVVGGATWILTIIPPEFGEVWGSLFVLYLFFVVLIAFIGRWAIVKIINKIRGYVK
jgi:hypothetical protein